jgi:hypothetical protein
MINTIVGVPRFTATLYPRAFEGVPVRFELQARDVDEHARRYRRLRSRIGQSVRPVLGTAQGPPSPLLRLAYAMRLIA